MQLSIQELFRHVANPMPEQLKSNRHTVIDMAVFCVHKLVKEKHYLQIRKEYEDYCVHLYNNTY